MNDIMMGQRVRVGRELKNYTQQQLSDAMGFNDRQTLSDIENGKRALKAHELELLCEHLEQEIDFFIDPFVVTGEAMFSWRAGSDFAENKLIAFEQAAGRYVGMFRWLFQSQNRGCSALKPMLRLSAKRSYEEVQQAAENLVGDLCLGEIPAKRLLEKIECQLNIPVLFFESTSDASVSGAAVHLVDLNAILINRFECEGRRNYDLAHELFHVLTWDAMQPNHLESNAVEQPLKGKRIEQLANNFASALLMPSTSLKKLLIPVQSSDITHLMGIAETFCVTPQALAWRLFNLGWINKASCDSLQKQKQQPSTTPPPKLYSAMMLKLLHQALSNGDLSVRKAARAVGLGIDELSTLFQSYEMTVPYDL